MDKSTPISSLNNNGDESEVVNNILQKYNNLQDESKQPKNDKLEQDFENRDLNKEMYKLNSENVAYSKHLSKEKKRVEEYEEIQEYPEEEIYEEFQDEADGEIDDEYEENNEKFEDIPLWKKFLNEIRIPIFIFLVIIGLSNSTIQKMIVKKLPVIGNQFNEYNIYGFLLSSFLIAVISYILIRFIRF